MLMLVPFKKTILAIVAVLAVGGGTFWAFSGPSEPWVDLDRATELVYRRVASEVRQRLVVPPERVITIPAIEGDIDGAFRGRLLEAVRDSGSQAYAPQTDSDVAQSWLEKASSGGFDWDSLTSWLGKKDDASEQGVVLIGRLDKVDNDERWAAELTWVELDRGAQALLVPETQTRSELVKSWFDGDYQKIRIQESSRWLRLGGWLLLLMLPALAATPLIKQGLKKESNFTNAMMVLMFAFPGTIAGWILTAYGSGWWGGALSFFSAVCALAFSFLYCSLLEAHR